MPRKDSATAAFCRPALARAGRHRALRAPTRSLSWAMRRVELPDFGQARSASPPGTGGRAAPARQAAWSPSRASAVRRSSSPHCEARRGDRPKRMPFADHHVYHARRDLARLRNAGAYRQRAARHHGKGLCAASPGAAPRHSLSAGARGVRRSRAAFMTLLDSVAPDACANDRVISRQVRRRCQHAARAASCAISRRAAVFFTFDRILPRARTRRRLGRRRLYRAQHPLSHRDQRPRARKSPRCLSGKRRSRKSKPFIVEMWDNLGRTDRGIRTSRQIAPSQAPTRASKSPIWRLGDRIIEQGKGILFVSGHFGNWEIMPFAADRIRLRRRPSVSPAEQSRMSIAGWCAQRAKNGRQGSDLARARRAPSASSRCCAAARSIFLLVDQKTKRRCPGPVLRARRR